MKNLALFFAVVLFCVIACAGCSKSVADGPLGVNQIMATNTPTATPDTGYRVFVTEAGAPVAGVTVQMAPEGVTVPVSSLTDSKGAADFPVHSGGKWNLTLPSPLGYETLNYTVEPLSNTVFAVELGKQELQVELISGSENLPISPSSLIYRVTYKAGASKLYNIALTGLPADIVPQMTTTQVRHNNDVAFITLNFPKSYEGLTSASVKVVGTAASGGQVIESAVRNVVKGWGFGVNAEMKFAKTYLEKSDNYPYEQQLLITIYWIGLKEYNYDAQAFAIDGTVKTEYVNHVFTGGMPYIENTYLNNTTIPFGEGAYPFLIKAESDGDGGWTRYHDDVNANVQIRFFDDEYLDVTRTFTLTQGFGELCGHYEQCCYMIATGEFDKCGSYPNTTGCFYYVDNMHKSRSGRTQGY